MAKKGSFQFEIEKKGENDPAPSWKYSMKLV